MAVAVAVAVVVVVGGGGGGGGGPPPPPPPSGVFNAFPMKQCDHIALLWRHFEAYCAYELQDK